MEKQVIIRKNAYYDSVTLMSLASKIEQLDGVHDAIVAMATAMNKELAGDIGLVTDEVEAAGDNDLLLAVSAENEKALEEAFTAIEAAFEAKSSQANKQTEKTYTNTKEALRDHEEANLAIISVSGEFAAREAEIALKKGLHVMIFSDNVSVEDERRLKELGRNKGLFVMGPDCGTAILNGTGLCFANSVRRGNIGLVAASGTGLQEVTVQIDRLGGGVSQGIGTGGRDLSKDIGGLMMLQGIKALEEDPDTDVIVLISKPPAKEVQDLVLEQVKASRKPVVISFIDGDPAAAVSAGAIFGYSLTDTAIKAVALSKGEEAPDKPADQFDKEAWETVLNGVREKRSDSQIDIRGLYGGGTLCAEALSIMRQEGLSVKSNVAKREEEKLFNTRESEGHVLLDLGEDEFTVGKPHPMIDPTTRNQRLLQEAADEKTAVILMDFELGYGSHEDPVGVSLPFIEEARVNNPSLAIVSYVCGTATDPQGLESAESRLREAGVAVANSNVEAVRLAVHLQAAREVSA